MGFESHKIVKEYSAELDKITATRQELRTQLIDVWERLQKTDDDRERNQLALAGRNLEASINSITAKGNQYLLKIDQLNGVR